MEPPTKTTDRTQGNAARCSAFNTPASTAPPDSIRVLVSEEQHGVGVERWLQLDVRLVCRTALPSDGNDSDDNREDNDGDADTGNGSAVVDLTIHRLQRAAATVGGGVKKRNWYPAQDRNGRPNGPHTTLQTKPKNRSTCITMNTTRMLITHADSR